jgi:hypothetical protein
MTPSHAGMQGRCVWTDERGDMVYSELRGEAVGSGNRIVGTFEGHNVTTRTSTSRMEGQA